MTRRLAALAAAFAITFFSTGAVDPRSERIRTDRAVELGPYCFFRYGSDQVRDKVSLRPPPYCMEIAEYIGEPPSGFGTLRCQFRLERLSNPSGLGPVAIELAFVTRPDPACDEIVWAVPRQLTVVRSAYRTVRFSDLDVRPL